MDYLYIVNSKINGSKCRNLTSHTYNEQAAEDIINNIRAEYFFLLENLQNRLEEEISGKQSNLFDD
ncbi:MAG: nucleotidyltransferase substrate binding protein [Bacteroidales bacterium]|nr:nucleotidyltransferase substrate binding protein [Bacteroidales bacterium]